MVYWLHFLVLVFFCPNLLWYDFRAAPNLFLPILYPKLVVGLGIAFVYSYQFKVFGLFVFDRQISNCWFFDLVYLIGKWMLELFFVNQWLNCIAYREHTDFPTLHGKSKDECVCVCLHQLYFIFYKIEFTTTLMVNY